MADVTKQLADLNNNAKNLLQKYDGAFSKIENLSKQKQKEIDDKVKSAVEEINKTSKRNIVQHSRSDTAVTASQNGFEFLKVQIIPKRENSKFKVQAVVSGQGGDDTRTYIERKINNGHWEKVGGNGQMGDHAWVHRSNEGAISLSFLYLDSFHYKIGDKIEYRVRPCAENGNNGGFWLNEGINSNHSDKNTNHLNGDRGTSTLIVEEV